MKKISIALMLLLTITLSACSSLDVVQKDAIRAFNDVLAAFPAEQKDGWYQLTSPDIGAKLVFSNNVIWLEADAAPFLAAGLDTTKYEGLTETIFYPQSIGFMLPSFDMLNRNIKDNASAQFAADLPFVREYLGYHAVMDHFNLNFSGAVFEWAKDMATNGYDNSVQDKDIVFVLNPEPFIAAGVDPTKVEGWAYAQVEVDEGGKMVNVWKLLKAVDLR